MDKMNENCCLSNRPCTYLFILKMAFFLCIIGILQHYTFDCLSPLQVLVLLTGGDWDPQYESQWKSYANNLKNLPADMYSFSIGSTPSQDQLQGVIPYNRNIFRVDSYDAADGRRPELVQAINGGKVVEQVC